MPACRCSYRPLRACSLPNQTDACTGSHLCYPVLHRGELLLALYQYRQGKRVQSALLTANAVNMRNDVIISLGVLVGLVFTFALDMPVLDTVTGLVISLFIIKSSVTIFMDSNVELMDGVKDETVYARIFQAVEAVPGAHNPHRVRSRQIGNMYMIALDIEVDGTISVMEAHRIANEVERSIKRGLTIFTISSCMSSRKGCITMRRNSVSTGEWSDGYRSE